MSALEMFSYSGQQVRTVIVDGEPWFVAADVCRILEHTNPTMAVSSLDDDEKGLSIVDTLGGQQSLAIVNEPGLYSLIIRSRKAEAKSFKRWLTHDVLPTIRRTGQFGSALPTNFAEALELAAVKVRALEAAEAVIAENAPKVEAFDALMDADGYYPMEHAAKVMGVGRTTFFRMLRDAGVIERGSTMPYQRYMHHFVITVGTYTDRFGVKHPTHTPRLKPSALPFIRQKLGLDVKQLALAHNP